MENEENRNMSNNADCAENTAGAVCKKKSLRMTGSFNHSLDAKGRLVVPQRFRERLGETFCIAPSLDFKSIALYSNEVWEERNEAYEKLGRLNPSVNMYLEQFYALSYDEQECDGQGRVLLPANIRQKILKDEREVEITGANDHVRIVAESASNAAWTEFTSQLPDLLQLIGTLEQQNLQS